jgi:hypothetical protein
MYARIRVDECFELKLENKITHKPYDADQGKGNELELLRDKRLELFIFYNTAKC